MDTEAVKRVLLADMALQNGAAGRDLTMATKRFRQAVFKTTFKKNKHMVSPVAPSRTLPTKCNTHIKLATFVLVPNDPPAGVPGPLCLCGQITWWLTAIMCLLSDPPNWSVRRLRCLIPCFRNELTNFCRASRPCVMHAQIVPGRRGKAPVIPVQVDGTRLRSALVILCTCTEGTSLIAMVQQQLAHPQLLHAFHTCT